MFSTSISTEKLDAAMAKAQGAIEEAEMNCKNPFFNSVYADLTSVWRACRTALSSNGISVTQWPIESSDGRIHMVTRLAHAGEWMQATFSAPVAKQDAQGYGSAITYLKRFTLCAAVGVVADSDDDANAAVDQKKPMPVSKEAFSKAKKSSNGAVSVTNLVQAQREVEKEAEPPAFIEARKQREMNQASAEELTGIHVPGPRDAYAPPAGFPEPTPVSNAEIFNAAEYVIEFGKYKGKRLKEIGKIAVQASLDWIEKDTDKSRPLAKSLANFKEYGTMFVNS